MKDPKPLTSFGLYARRAPQVQLAETYLLHLRTKKLAFWLHFTLYFYVLMTVLLLQLLR